MKKPTFLFFGAMIALFVIIIATILYLRNVEGDHRIAPILLSYDRLTCNFNYAWRKDKSHTDVQKLATRLRSYVNISHRLQDCYERSDPAIVVSFKDIDQSDFVREYTELQYSVFPFFQEKKSKTIEQRIKSFSGRGVVFTVCSIYFRYALVLLRNLQLVGNTLPIKAFYRGDTDLTVREKALLRTYGVQLVDILTLVDDTSIRMDGFSIKPFALFFSSFREAILIDLDTVFYRNPELLFQLAGYKQTGSLMFLDRVVQNRRKHSVDPQWFDQNMPRPISDRLKQTLMYRDFPDFQVHPGVLLMDKSRTAYAILAACTLMTKAERQSWFSDCFVGDTDSLWLGFELVDQSYSLQSADAGVIGKLHVNPTTNLTEVCGNLMHPGDDRRPFWSVGGVVAKHHKDFSAQTFVAFALGGLHNSTLRESCFEKVTPQNLTVVEQSIVNPLTKLWTNSAELVTLL